MCDDIQATLAELRGKGVEVARDVCDQGWAADRNPPAGWLRIPRLSAPAPIAWSTLTGCTHLAACQAVPQGRYRPSAPGWILAVGMAGTVSVSSGAWLAREPG
jgi:hypothetical protein